MSRKWAWWAKWRPRLRTSALEMTSAHMCPLLEARLSSSALSPSQGAKRLKLHVSARRRTASNNGLTTCKAAWTYCKKQRIRQRQTRRVWTDVVRLIEDNTRLRSERDNARARAGSGSCDPVVANGGPSCS